MEAPTNNEKMQRFKSILESGTTGAHSNTFNTYVSLVIALLRRPDATDNNTELCKTVGASFAAFSLVFADLPTGEGGAPDARKIAALYACIDSASGSARGIPADLRGPALQCHAAISGLESFCAGILKKPPAFETVKFSLYIAMIDLINSIFFPDGGQGSGEINQLLFPVLSTVRPREYAILNDKVNNEMFKGSGSKKEVAGQMAFLWAVDQAGQGEKDGGKSITAFVSTLYRGPEISSSRELAPADLLDLDAISTIILNEIWQGKEAPFYVTPEEIWRVENGITDTRKTPTEKERAAICARVDKMRYTEIYIDCTAEIRERNYTFNDDRLKTGQIKDNFLHAMEADAMTEKGNKVNAYAFLSLPILTAYNMEKGNLLYIDYSMLDTSDKTRNDDITRAFRRYLIQQVYLLAYGKRDNNVILYDTIYKAAGIPTPAERYDPKKSRSQTSYNSQIRNEATKDREKIAAILESWKEKNIILEYSQTKTGRKYTGIKIKINPEFFKPKKHIDKKNK